jgi:hypothetical protein
VVEQDSEVKEMHCGGGRFCLPFQAFAFGSEVLHIGDKVFIGCSGAL